jgi:glutamyl-tRNA reductase
VSVLVVGLSHKTAPVDLLEKVAISGDHVPKALHELQQGANVVESLVLSTCNRVEVYAHVTRFHGGVQEVTDLLSRLSGVPLDELSDHLYVHYEERAVHHLFTVASGLDSMVVGEGQILGQVRNAFKTAQEEKSVGRVLGELFRHSLRVGKRVRTETAIGRAGASLVGIGLRVATAALGPLSGANALIVGAGSMGALAGATLRREGVGEVVVANRTPERAAALAATLDGRGIGLDDLAGAIAAADLVVSSTGASGVVIDADLVRDATRDRTRPLFFLDLALPRDVDPAVREIDGVRLADLDALRAVLDTEDTGNDVDECRAIVNDEVAVFLGWQRAMRVAPTVVALRAKADALIEAELDRLTGRLPELDSRSRGEVDRAVRRVVDKLLHAPTVRVRELAEAPGGDHYAEALRELFGLDPQVPEAIVAPEDGR